MARYLYSELASTIQARRNCIERCAIARDENASQWINRHEATIDQLAKDFMPSGSGFDSGTKLDLDLSHGEKLVFTTAYHHMNNGGYYDGWTEHTVIATPSFSGFNLRITGRNRNDIKDYIGETFHASLSRMIAWDDVEKCWFDPELRKAYEDYQRRVTSGEVR